MKPPILLPLLSLIILLAGCSTLPVVDNSQPLRVRIEADSTRLALGDASAELRAVLEDAAPDSAVTYRWSQRHGPAETSFTPLDAATTTVTLPDIGHYTLEVTASTATDEASQTITLFVSAEQNAAPEGHPLWVDYANTPDTHPNIPNVSYAGYRYGEIPIPTLDGPLYNVRDYGATGDGNTDDTAAVRSAVGAVGPDGGVVYFPDGNYRLSGPLFVHSDNTVLRGQSRDATRLVFTQALRQGYAQNTHHNGSSRWSWTGGLIWFTPATRNTYVADVSEIGSSFSEAWPVGATLSDVTAAASRGDQTVTVSSTAGLSVGDVVFVEIDNAADLSTLKHLTGDGLFAETYDWSTSSAGGVINSGRDVWPDVLWPVEIAALSGAEVTFKQPLRFDLRPEWNPRLRAMGETLRGSGLESMTLEMARDSGWSRAEDHNQEDGWNGPFFNNVIDGFARDLTVTNADIGLGVSASKNITLSDFEVAAESRFKALHHGTTVRNASHDILFKDFTLSAPVYHGINVEGFSMGNVWSRGTMQHGTFDAHRLMPVENIRTEILVNNSGVAGGAPDAGPHAGARFVHWNIDVLNGRTHSVCEAGQLPVGALVGVRGCTVSGQEEAESVVMDSGMQGSTPAPANLYEAQLAWRLANE